MTRHLRRGLVACLVLLGSLPAAAQSIPCGEPYTVRRGDTLNRIAVRAYGPSANYRDLLEPNRGVFVRGDPSLLEVGQVLSIPCRGAEVSENPGPAGRRDAPAGSQSGETQAAAEAASGAQATTVARSGPSIVAVETALTGAMMPALSQALSRAGLGGAGTGDPVRDPQTVLAALKAAPSPAIGTGMPRLPCDAAATLSESLQALCQKLEWSEPMGETVLATFTLADADPVRRDAALSGKRLCMPDGVPRALLEARGLTEPAVLLRFAETAEGCFTMLRTGMVEAVIVPAAAADSTLESLRPGAQVAEQFALAQLVSLHAVALRDDPAALAALARLDTAVETMRADGSWLALLGASHPN